MTTKSDCYKCKHRGDLAGSAHSRCNHPAFQWTANPAMDVMAILSSVGRVPPVRATAEGIEVAGNPHGVRHGWFNHPWNFDPVWLEKCTGHEDDDSRPRI